MIEGLLDTLLSKLKNIVETETVVGKPIETKDTIIIPITKISLGFGAGGGESSNETKNKGGGSGTGGGAVIEPVAVITIHKGEVKVNNLQSKANNFGKIVDLVPDILEKIAKSKSKKKENTQGE